MARSISDPDVRPSTRKNIAESQVGSGYSLVLPLTHCVTLGQSLSCLGPLPFSGKIHDVSSSCQLSVTCLCVKYQYMRFIVTRALCKITSGGHPDVQGMDMKMAIVSS